MRFQTRITFMAQGAPVRDASGGTTWEYSPVAGLTDWPAMIQANVTELRLPDMTPDDDRYVITIPGSHPEITTAWVVLDGVGVYEITRVEADPLRGRMTRVDARRVAL